MIIEPTTIDGLYTVIQDRHSDDRGHFARTWCIDEFADAGINLDFVQGGFSNNATRSNRILLLQGPRTQRRRLEEEDDDSVVIVIVTTARRRKKKKTTAVTKDEDSRSIEDDRRIVSILSGNADSTFRCWNFES